MSEKMMKIEAEAEAITKILVETREKVKDIQSEWIGMRECGLCKRR